MEYGVFIVFCIERGAKGTWVTWHMPNKTTYDELQDLQNKPYDSELHAALVSAQRENVALEKLRRAREEAASLVPWTQVR